MTDVDRKLHDGSEVRSNIAVYGSCNPVNLYEKIKRIGGKISIVIDTPYFLLDYVRFDKRNLCVNSFNRSILRKLIGIYYV